VPFFIFLRRAFASFCLLLMPCLSFFFAVPYFILFAVTFFFLRRASASVVFTYAVPFFFLLPRLCSFFIAVPFFFIFAVPYFFFHCRDIILFLRTFASFCLYYAAPIIFFFAVPFSFFSYAMI
jgi:hypothetical protein